MGWGKCRADPDAVRLPHPALCHLSQHSGRCRTSPPPTPSPARTRMHHAPPCPHRHPDAVRLRTRGRRRRRRLGLRLGRGDGGGLRSRLATQQATEHARHLAAGGVKEGAKVVRVAKSDFGRTQIGFENVTKKKGTPKKKSARAPYASGASGDSSCRPRSRRRPLAASL